MAEGKCSEIFLNEVPGGVLDSMIKFMYGACKSIPNHMAVDLFVAADKFQVVALRELCLETINSDVLTNETVLELLEVADKLHCEELLSACLEYLTDKSNSGLVAKQPYIKDMMVRHPDLMQKVLLAFADEPPPRSRNLSNTAADLIWGVIRRATCPLHLVLSFFYNLHDHDTNR